MEQDNEMQTRQRTPRGGEQSSAFQRYRLGWVLLSMIATAVAVVLAGGNVAATIMLPLIVGAFVFRSALVEDYKRRQAEEAQES